MKILQNADDRRIKLKSSIDQFDSFLSIYKQGGQIPIAFDVIESITCDGIKSHKAIFTFDPKFKGYIYPVGHCTKTKIQYLLTDERGVVADTLPECGDTSYQKYVDRKVIVNADNEAVGVANVINYRVGLDYYEAEDTLPYAG